MLEYKLNVLKKFIYPLLKTAKNLRFNHNTYKMLMVLYYFLSVYITLHL